MNSSKEIEAANCSNVSGASKKSSRKAELLTTRGFMSLETGHGDMIHDARMNLVGTQIATASEDRTVRVFAVDVNSGYHQLRAELKGHEGPVWQISWAHPKFGNMLASCSYDKTVIVWKKVEKDGKLSLSTLNGSLPIPSSSTSTWENLLTYKGHTKSVNCVSWAPVEVGLVLACGSSDGNVSILSCDVPPPPGKNYAFTFTMTVNTIIDAHLGGCNAVSWFPSQNRNEIIKRFVTGGNDNMVKIWREELETWIEEVTLCGHSDWVRDVAWASTSCNQAMKIASASQDGVILVWSKRDRNDTEEMWSQETVKNFTGGVWNVSWSTSSDILVVSGGENTVSLLKQKTKGVWECVNSTAINEESVTFTKERKERMDGV